MIVVIERRVCGRTLTFMGLNIHHCGLGPHHDDPWHRCVGCNEEWKDDA